MHQREFVDGLWCTVPWRAAFDEVARLGELRQAVVAMSMTLAARIVTLEELVLRAHSIPAWTGIPLFREAVALADDNFLSPQEVRMYLAWILDADLPRPLVNVPVFDLHGRLLGYPDLLDVESGTVGEYDGPAHLSPERHRRDLRREGGYRDAGLECFTLVAGDLGPGGPGVDRMIATRNRAKFLAPGQRQWTLVPPPWWTPPPWLSDRYGRWLLSRRVDPAA